MSRTLIIGLGTGRCGTNTLAALLDMQPDTQVTHERFGHSLHWQGSENLVRELIASGADATSYGDVHSAYLPYAAEMLGSGESSEDEIRFVCLEREREATVDSFLRKTERKANHWAPTPFLARHARWNDSFPTYEPHLDKREAIGRYWDEYHTEAMRLQSQYPEEFRIFEMQALNDEQGQSAILDFIGIAPDQQRLEPGLRMNVEVPRRHGLAKILDWF
jgi:hypothetical protein